MRVSDPWDKPVVLTRMWCIYEIFRCIALDCKLSVTLRWVHVGERLMYSNDIHTSSYLLPHHHHCSESNAIALSKQPRNWFASGGLLERIDVRSASASVESDLRMIRQAITDTVGFEVLNQQVCVSA